MDASLRSHDETCGDCFANPPSFDRTFALFPYEQPVIKLITGLKFEHDLAYAKALGDLLADRIQTAWYVSLRLPDVIIPIPLHPERMRERGFNQALEIARPVSRKLGIPIDFSGTKRCRHTARQSDLPAKKRGENIAGAFACRAHYNGRKIAVIDDVITTGQTIKEFCGVLRESGAEKIDVWCCARV